MPVLTLLMSAGEAGGGNVERGAVAGRLSAAWVYLHKGAVLPTIAVPSVAGMMQARASACACSTAWTAPILQLVIGVLLFAGVRALLKSCTCG